MATDYQSYDFLDFGASEGGSIQLAKTLFGTDRGLGIDIDPEKVRHMLAAGNRAIEGDVTDLDVPTDAVRFVMISHILEHLPSLRHVEATLRSAARVASDFLYIQGPFFDADDYLADRGLKLYWSDWSGHPCHLTIVQLGEILECLGLPHQLWLRQPVTSSSDSAIHPMASPGNQKHYDPQRHPPKPYRFFDRIVYHEFICLVRLRQLAGWQEQTDRVRRLKRAMPRADCPRLVTNQSHHRLDRLADRQRQREMRTRLLLEKGWDFLLFLHLRKVLRGLQGEVSKVALLNTRRGYLEVALALEFLDVEFRLLPSEGASRGRFDPMDALIRDWQLDNVRRGDPGSPPDGDTDLVAAAMILDGSQEDARRLQSLRQGPWPFVWLLTSFNGRGDRPWRGYSAAEIHRSLPHIVASGGCFWSAAGKAFYDRLRTLSPSQIREHQAELEARAQADLRDAPPAMGESFGIWALAARSSA